MTKLIQTNTTQMKKLLLSIFILFTFFAPAQTIDSNFRRLLDSLPNSKQSVQLKLHSGWNNYEVEAEKYETFLSYYSRK